MSDINICSAWVQVDRRRHYHTRAEQRIVLHIPSPVHPDHGRCGAELRHATPVSREGARTGQRCQMCERSAQAAGVRR